MVRVSYYGYDNIGSNLIHVMYISEVELFYDFT